MKHEPYVITELTEPGEIVDLIRRAYDEGYSDGYEEGQKHCLTIPVQSDKIITNPAITPTDEWWRQHTIYCTTQDVPDTKLTTEAKSSKRIKS